MKRFLIGLSCLLFTTVIFANDVKVPRLSPLPFPIEQERVMLTGDWAFNPAPHADFMKMESVQDWDKIEVPGEWVMQGFKVEPGATAAYFRTFNVPASWEGQRVKLRCNAIFSESEVFINGESAGSHLGGFTAFEYDVTPLLKFGSENRIAVSVVAETIVDSLATASIYACHSLGGISRDIYLYALPQTNLSMFHVSTTFDDAYTDANLIAEVEVSNDGENKSGKHHLVFTLTDAEGEAIELKNSDVDLKELAAGESQSLKLEFPVKNPHKWDPEHPYLYRLTCQFMEGDKVMYTTYRRVGFRQVEVRGSQVFVNNQVIKLRGICHHEVMPLRGRSVNNDMWRKDVELFRQGNVNYFRTSHYPPAEELLEACDELGMFVEVEAPFCWAHSTPVPDSLHYLTLVNQTMEMLSLHRSHPSVIIWSLGNESGYFNEYFREAGEHVKAVDPTRPRNFSQHQPAGDEGALEIANHHYPGSTGPDMYKNFDRPVVFDEFCHLNAYNRYELASDPTLRSNWGVLLDRMWDGMYRAKSVLGGALWAGIDDTFFTPDGKTLGYGTWGPLDGWRRKKPEYWGMKKAFSPVKIELNGNLGADGKLVFVVENQHFFSNLKETKIEWNVNGKKGSVSPDIAPGQKGTFEITVPEEVRSYGYVDLTVIGTRGYVVDEYHFQTLPHAIEKVAAAKGGKIKMTENEEAYLVHVNGGEYSVDKRSGLLSSTRNGKEILVKTPELMMLPLNMDQGGAAQMIGQSQFYPAYNPVCQNWVTSAVGVRSEGKELVFRIEGHYSEAVGAFEYRFLTNGEIEFSYDFEVQTVVNPRQLGIVFSLPESFDHLSWNRKGYWSVYPEDQIDALQGEADAHKASLPIVSLAGPSEKPAVEWAEDQTAEGSNMFRSTKENIYEASLTDDVNEVKVLSDGTQHFRAWKDKKAIKFLVADYSNAGTGDFVKYHAEDDYKPLRYGNRINGTVKLVVY